MPSLDEVMFRFIQDPSAQMAALRAGDVDVIGAAIALAVLGCNLLGDGPRDLLDPKLSRQR